MSMDKDTREIDLEKCENEFFDNHLAYSIMVLANMIAKHTTQVTLKKASITLNEWRVIRLVSLFGPISAKDIIHIVGMDKTTVSRTITKLHANKLIKLSPNTQDRRQTLLSLAAGGRRVIEQVRPAAESADKEFENQLSDEQIKHIGPIIGKLRRYLIDVMDQ